MLAIFTPNILKYVRKTLHIKAPVQSYYRPLDHLNITYIVAPITLKSKFRDLDFLISDVGDASD